MKMTSLDNMNIIKDLFLVPNEPVKKEEEKEKGEIVENAIIDSFRRDKNNLKMLMEVGLVEKSMMNRIIMKNNSHVLLK